MLTRREMFAVAAAVPAALSHSVFAADPVVLNPKGRLGLGVAPAAYGKRSAANRAASVDMLDWAHDNGYGGLETNAPPADPAAINALRNRLEAYRMRIVFNVPLPRTDAALPAFEAGVKNAAAVGAVSIHEALTQRRYEAFNDFETFYKAFHADQEAVARAEPVLAKYKVRVALENHKGWRSAEQAAWLKKLGSPWVGVHFDFGNNVSLCELPGDTLNNLLPYVFSSHIKDMAVQSYEEGFLLSEVVLGDGALDLKGMVATLRKKDPEMMFNQETITRDPLKIPIFTEKYWATFDDPRSMMSGHDVAKMVDFVRKNPPKQPLPKTTGLSPEAALRFEDDNNRRGLEYARRYLDL